jgi:hypothetical protein
MQKQLMDIFKFYRWNELYEVVKAVEYNPDVEVHFIGYGNHPTVAKS